MRTYFVTWNKSDEINVIKKLKPSHILISYWCFKNKDLGEWVSSLGYKPIILLDSGAYTAYGQNKDKPKNKQKTIDLKRYIKYIRYFNEYIDFYISLDVIDDGEASKTNYRTMLRMGLYPIPVFHYSKENNEALLKSYRMWKCNIIALGGSVKIRDKQVVRNWVIKMIMKYPGQKYHLLGSTSSKITSLCGLTSCDSTSWIMMAKNGYPKHIQGNACEDKKNRAEQLIKDISSYESGGDGIITRADLKKMGETFTILYEHEKKNEKVCL